MGIMVNRPAGSIDFPELLVQLNIINKDDQIKLPEDNPTLGIILCAEKNKTMAKYSVLSDKDNLFASKYMLYLPTEEELQMELERERLLIESKLKEENHG